MPNAFVWKPFSTGQQNRGGLSVVLGRPEGHVSQVGVYNQGGQLIENLHHNPGVPHPGEDPAVKYFSTKPGSSYGDNVTVRVNYADGTQEEYPIGRGSQYYRGTLGDPESLQASNVDPSVGNFGGGGGGGFPGLSPGSPYGPVGFGFGVGPADLTKFFPSPVLTKGAPYTPVDPMDFAQRWGDFNRGEIGKNFEMAQGMALKEINTELQGMQSFVPAASALKRSEINIDNLFNQQQRTQQIDSTLPGVRDDLDAQAGRARSYASGRAPDEVTDRALELGIRSSAADQASAGGFGVRSSVARKASDLMSAEQRIKLSQYGDQLLTGNIGTKANLLLAPTEYSDAGSQIQVNPRVSAAELTARNLTEANALTTISPGQALSTEVQQNQFQTTMQQNVNNLNANIKNQFRMSKFGYRVGLAGAYAGAAQTGINTQLALEQQAAYAQIFQDHLENAQESAQTGAIAQGVGALLPSVISAIGSMFGGGGEESGGGSAASGGGDFQVAGPDPLDTGSTFEVPPFSLSPDAGPSAPDVSAGGITAGSPTPDFVYDSGGSQVSFGNDGQISSPQVETFSQDIGLGSNPNAAVTRSLLSQSAGTLRAAGVSSQPAPGMQSIGYAPSGAPMFASSAMLRSADVSAGSNMVTGVRDVLNPMGVFSQEDRGTLDRIANVSSDASLIAKLDQLRGSGDTKEFVNTLLGRFGQPAINKIVSDPKDRAGLGSAFTGYQLFQNWDRMSPAQKAMGMASLGIQGAKFGGVNLAAKPIIKPVVQNGKVVDPGLSVGQGLALFQAGYNTYALVKNWDQLNALQKVAMGTGNAAQIANVAKSFNLLGAGTQGAEVAGVTAAKLAQSGWQTAPQFGPGAVVSQSANAAAPEGFVSFQTSSGTVAAPAGTAEATKNAIAQEGGSLLGTAAGAAGVALGAWQVYKGWGSGGKGGLLQGTLGGSAMAAGLYGMSAVAGGLGPAALANPYLLGGVVAVSILGNAIHTGKSADQLKREAVRGAFKQTGLVGSDNMITLPDGTKFDFGIDGGGGQHNISDKSKLAQDHRNLSKLNAYDIDYTNDLDYSAGMGGIALSRLLTGSKAKNIDQVGNQLGNASLGNIGYGEEFSKENFDKLQNNMRSMYAQSGIKSKADAFQLANQAYAEKRINESDLVSMHQAFNMMYDDNGFQTAQQLMAGRFRGIETINQLPAEAPMQEEASKKVPTPMFLRTSKEEVVARNRQRYAIAA